MSVSVTKITNPYSGLNSVLNTEEYGGCTGLHQISFASKYRQSSSLKHPCLKKTCSVGCRLLATIPTLLALDVFGMLKESALLQLRQVLCNIEVNKFPFSSIARPTTGIRRTSIWGVRVRDTAI